MTPPPRLSSPSKMKHTELADRLLSDTLFPDGSSTTSNDSSEPEGKDPLASRVWRLYTKAKDNLPNGARMENLTWRMMAMTLKKKEREQPKDTDNYNAMVIDDEGESPAASAISIAHPSSPPEADDTTAFLSSSAPPYMVDFFQQENSTASFHSTIPPAADRNVMVLGSTRALSSTSIENPMVRTRLSLFSLPVLLFSRRY